MDTLWVNFDFFICNDNKEHAKILSFELLKAFDWYVKIVKTLHSKVGGKSMFLVSVGSSESMDDV